MICPYCNQGPVRAAKIKLESSKSERVQYCDECDTVWLLNESISNETGKNFEDFMTERRLAADWNLIVFD